jgi:predicted nuclease of restriction endonuclease-like (RecB) superfamily
MPTDTFPLAPLLDQLKSEIRGARLQAMRAANAELLGLYWRIGNLILTQQQAQGWGAKVIDQLSAGLRQEFPTMQGLSARNLKYMRRFAEAYPDAAFVQATLAQIPWYHHLALLEKVPDEATRLHYVAAAAQNGWSRDVMVHQIEAGHHRRQGQAITNFATTLPPEQSELARQTLKDPYLFDFLNLTDDVLERDLQRGMLEHITKLLLELGNGFAYMGQQVHLEVGGQDFYLDLLFYHVRLRAYVVVELKITEFKPEYAGKLNFYLTAVDEQLRHPDDRPSIGLLLCKSRNSVVAEYALRDVHKPIGVAEYRLGEHLPEALQAALPSVAALEQQLNEKLASAPSVDQPEL